MASTLLAVGLGCADASAQVPVGSTVALTQDIDTGARRLFVIPGAGGLPVQVTGSAPTMAGNISRVAVDPISPYVDPSSMLLTRGHLIVVSQSAAGNELWQLYLSGTHIVNDRKLGDLPAGDVLELHRSGSGCYMTLTTLGSSATLSRVSVVENGASVYNQTLSGLTGGKARGLTTGPDGFAYVAETFNVVAGVLPPSRLARVGVDGLLTSVGSVSFTVNALAFNGTIPGSALAAGGLASVAANTNFSCGFGEVAFGPPLVFEFGALWPMLQDIELDAANGAFVVALGGGAIGGAAGYGSEVRRYAATGCSLSGPTVVASFFNQVTLDVSISTGSIAYGCAAPTSGGTYPVIGQVAPPSVGNTWIATLAAATPSAVVQLYVGFNTSAYLGLLLPLEVSAFGAQPGATLVTSGNLVLNTAADPAGNASTSIAVPNNPSLIGQKTYAQWSVIDALLPYALPIALSGALAPTIQ